MPEQPKTPSALAIPLWVIAVALLLIAGAVAFQGYLEITRRNAGIARDADAADAAGKVVIPRPSGLRPAKTATPPPTLAKPSPLPPPRAVPAPLLAPRVGSVPLSVPAAIPPAITNASDAVATSRLPVPELPVKPAVVILPAFVPDPNGPWITGRVVLRGTPPPEKPIVIDPMCSKARGEKVATTRFYLVGTDGGLADVVVYISKGLEGVKYAPPAGGKLINQVGCEFVPYVSAALTGQSIFVRNSDPVLHNVHPTPVISGNREYNRAHLPNGPDQSFVWQNAELFLRFKCDVHPWMFAYVTVLDHPFVGVTDEAGVFQIPLPSPGRYEIATMHRKAGSTAQLVEVEAGKGIDLVFTLDVPQ